MRIGVLGAGAWGTAMAISLASRHQVTLWARDASQAQAMAAGRSNDRYLAGERFPDELAVTADFAAATRRADLLLLAVTSAGLRVTLHRLKEADRHAPVVWLCKGFDTVQGKLPHQICAEELLPDVQCGVLSGPSFAQEVARGLPTAVTLASRDAQFARDAARAIHGRALRVYSAVDVVGVEVAGAVKNVMAIAAGICDGLQLGHNARAALITRGLAEITRLGVRLGGRAETFMGLAGAGDLILTCTGDLSRNRRVGLQLAAGTALPDILQKLGHVAEGVNTARVVDRMAGELQVDMPITRAVCRVLDRPAEARAAVQDLLQREPKDES